MIIFGTTGITSTKEEYQFFCPQCGQPSIGRRKAVRRFFTLYFIPVIPLDVMQEYIQCDRCRGSYSMEVLQYDPRQQADQFVEDLKRLMILIMLADGTVDDAEIETIQRIYAEFSGRSLPRDEIRQDVALAQEARISAVAYARRFAPRLVEEQKALVIKSAFLVATAAGDLQETRSQQLLQLGEVLQVPEERYRQYIQEALSS